MQRRGGLRHHLVEGSAAAHLRVASPERSRQEFSRWGPLTVEQVGPFFYICPEGGALPYSQAVSKAAELKRQSEGAVSPKLVRAG